LRLLVIGSGGREHALVWRLARDPRVSRIICAPGNPGIATLADVVRLDTSDPAVVLSLAEREAVDLTVIGPEVPLSRGVVDAFAARGLPIVGPTRGAARLESSKAFAKDFMSRHRVPTAPYVVCAQEADARAVIASDRFGFPVVLKADGLAAGKGVVVAGSRDEADAAITEIMRDRRFGDAGSAVVIEECLSGPELSFFVLSDGARALVLGSAQDHKRAFDGDLGPNTGGMGAFAPSPLCDPSLQARIVDDVVQPVLAGMRAEGHPYRGFLYCGLMLTPRGPRIIEFNVRLGDPEAQVVLPLVQGDFVGALEAAARGDIGRQVLSLRAACTVGVVLASGGYPDTFATGKPIEGLEHASAVPGVVVFHAGTSRRDGQIVTAGGRVLTIVGTADDYRTAMARAYQAADRIDFDGKHLRRDIGLKAIGSR
jgi:phosphoribosylamine---glycine ligase